MAVGVSCAAIVAGVAVGLSVADRCALAAPPLSIEHLLDEELPESPKEKEEILADNSPCLVCHGNYQEEQFALVHAKADVGCADCHGESYEHRNDEDNITPPDTMYAEADIGPACAKCHETHDAPAAAVIARWRECCPAEADAEKLVCTDCHGKHRLKFRTVSWNKKTRELIVRREVDPAKAAQEKAAGQPKESKASEAKAPESDMN